MRVLVAGHRHFVSGGPERYMFRAMDLLRDRGHQVVPFALAYARNEPSEYSSLFPDPPQGGDAVYYKQIEVGPLQRARIAAQTIYSPRIRRAAQHAIGSQHIDVVYALALGNWLYPELVLAAHSCGVPVVWRLSDLGLVCPRYDMLRQGRPCELCVYSLQHAVRHRCVKGSAALSILKVAAMHTQRVAGVLEHVRTLAFPSRFTLERHAAFGIDPQKLAYLPPLAPTVSTTRRPRPEHLLFVGNLLEHKGLDVVRRALKLIDDPPPLLVAGAELSQSLSGAKDVRYMGFLDYPALSKLYRKALAVLVPSLWYENAPNVVFEAMAHGAPVIASEIGSLPELVEHEQNGLLAAPGDAEHWARMIKRLMDDPQYATELGRAGRRTVRERFSEQVHWQALEGLLVG
ncbi:MAG: glycosyltransferase [Candidatus Alcyoniella australis]|nr:glycosyltransferase [Candidatus Alcyoniella australis]